MKIVKNKRIALMGESGSGKDYIVSILKDYGYCVLSFSDQLKRLAKDIYPWLEQDYPPEEKEVKRRFIVPYTGEVIENISPREIWLSLNCLRKVEDGIFVRMLALQERLLKCDNIVIKDVRTEPELEWCERNGYDIVFVNPIPGPKHPENSFDDFVRFIRGVGNYDYIINNNFSGREQIEKELVKIGVLVERN